MDFDSMDQVLATRHVTLGKIKTAKIKPYILTDDQYRFYRVDLVPDSQLPGSSYKIDLYHLML